MMCYVIIRGPLGVGKTTIAKALAQKLNGKYISVDEILSIHHFYEEASDGYCSEKSFLKANKVIIPAIRKNLKKGKITIIDGNFYRKSQLKDLATKLNSECYAFTLKASLQDCIERDEKRLKPIGKDATIAVYKAVNKFDYGTVINTKNKTAKQTLKEILSHFPLKK